MTARRGLLTGALLAAASVVAAQTLTINLAEIKPGASKSISVAPAVYSVQLLNRKPFQPYSYTARLITKPIAPFDAKVLEKTAAAAANPLAAVVNVPEPTECSDLKKATDAITADSVAEAQVPDLRKTLKQSNDKAAEVDCVDPNIKPRAALALADIDKMFDDTFLVQQGQTLEITIIRNGSDGKPLTWTASFDAGDRGDWRISYGFTFIPKQDQRWFSKAGSDAQKFTITRKTDASGLDFAPSIFFHWVPAGDIGHLTKDLMIGPTAGLGFDLSAPTVFAGLSLLYNENIALVGGAVLHQRDRLSGEFTPNQVIGENLSSDKLIEKGYGAAWFVGLTFRFGSKPAGFGPSQPAPETPKPSDKPADKTAADKAAKDKAAADKATKDKSTAEKATKDKAATDKTAADKATKEKAAANKATAPGDIEVWGNAATKVYHCPGTRYFKNTKQGQLMKQSDAQAKGYRPAYGKPCE
jgi:hypothetical protein